MAAGAPLLPLDVAQITIPKPRKENREWKIVEVARRWPRAGVKTFASQFPSVQPGAALAEAIAFAVPAQAPDPAPASVSLPAQFPHTGVHSLWQLRPCAASVGHGAPVVIRKKSRAAVCSRSRTPITLSFVDEGTVSIRSRFPDSPRCSRGSLPHVGH